MFPNRSHRFALAALVCILLAGAPQFSPADDSRGHGRSNQGEAFDEGPRQAATLLGESRVGKVSFPVSTSNQAAREFFQQGVAQLHGFAFFEAERSFRQVLLLDPNCALAHWGIALSNRHNPKRARELMQKAFEKKDAVSARERAWIQAFHAYFAEKPDEPARRRALVRALEELVQDAPQDVEAKVWLVLQVWDNSYNGIPIESFSGLDALLGEALRAEPNHPGAHHLRIHLWNNRSDKYALSSAAVCGQSAPGIAHMWHMPGHTYTKLNRFADAAWHQEAAARVDHAWVRERRILPDQIHNFAHNNDWLVETLGFLGRTKEAIALATNMIELPRLAPRTPVIGRKSFSEERSSHFLGARRLMELLLDFELWEDALGLAQTRHLGEQLLPIQEAARQRLLAAAHYSKGNTDLAAEAERQIEHAIERIARERVEAADEAERDALSKDKPAAEALKAATDVLQKKKPALDEARGYLSEARIYGAAAKKDGLPSPKAWKEASRLKGARKALLLLALGQEEEAEKTAAEALKEGPERLLPAAVQAEILWKRGKAADAKKIFETVRSLAADAPKDLPVLGRLAPLIAESGIPGEWRKKRDPSAEAAARPKLESLGPFHWEPETAAPWVLPMESGEPLSLALYRGKPVLVIFYLGSGCVHCLQQLNDFAPYNGRFQDLGISLVAVSTDTAPNLEKTFEKSKTKGGFPFPIVADPQLAAFQAYGAYDDFEKQPLHGLFLIDGKGRIRWQDISFQPFENPEWLLQEASRLLQF